MDAVELQIQDRIATLQFGEPRDKNVLHQKLLEAITVAIAEAESSQARVLMLRGRGGYWSAGYDIGAIPPDIFSHDAHVIARHPFERCMRAVENCRLPTLAAIQGAAFGGALELALWCDLRLATDETRFALPPARLGIVYSHTGLQKLVEVVGASQARRLIFLAEDIDAAEAERIGLVHEVSPIDDFEDVVADWAKRVSRGAPLAVQGMKKILQRLAQQPALAAEAQQEILEIRRQAYESADSRRASALSPKNARRTSRANDMGDSFKHRQPSAKDTIWSIGHSNQSLAELLAKLDRHRIGVLVDVRSLPRSKRNPQFNRDQLERHLADSGTGPAYRWLPDLGGMRRSSGSVSTNTALTGALRHYADYMTTQSFAQALTWLQVCARRHRTAYLCAEADPLRCHRRLISDALLQLGWHVQHILATGEIQEHRLSPEARVTTDGLQYPGTPELPF